MVKDYGKEADTVRFLETGLDPQGHYADPPMPEFRFRKKDALAVIIYLESLKRR